MQVHRTHLEIFEGRSLPGSLRNWFNDVWLGNVYRPFGACKRVPLRVFTCADTHRHTIVLSIVLSTVSAISQSCSAPLQQHSKP